MTKEEMMALKEETKKLDEARKNHTEFIPRQIPIGMTITTLDGNNQAMIVGMSDGQICLSCGVFGKKENVKISRTQLLSDWLLMGPDGLIICGNPPKVKDEIGIPMVEDKKIITPGDPEFQFTL